MGRLWYRQPATVWEEALPLGNGRIGAMVFGQVWRETIQVNEESMWYGGERNRNNPDTRQYLPQIREYLEQGKVGIAQKLANLAMAGCPSSMNPYQTLGDIVIEFDWPEGVGGCLEGVEDCPGDVGNCLEGVEDCPEDVGSCPQNVADYIRSLEMETGTITVSYRARGTTYYREAWVSRPAGCLVMRVWADRPGNIGFTARLQRPLSEGVGKWQEDGIVLYGSLGRGGPDYAMVLRAQTIGGSCRIIGENIVVTGADEAVLYFSAETTYHYSAKQKARMVKEQAALQTDLGRRLDACMETAYQEVKEAHIQDFKGLFSRVTFRLGSGQAMAEMPTDVRLNNAKNHHADPGLAQLLFDYGRYLLISSSRPGDLPANLQGIWNKELTPPWDSKYTVNINLQMNYWHAESCNLSECHLPVFELLKKMQRRGRKTAREMYGCRGFVCHHNTDIHGDTAPQDIWPPATCWAMGAAWLSLHLWGHYQYTMDRAFLREAFPILAEAALFFVDFLIPKGEFLVTSPSLSPENSYRTKEGEIGAVCAGPTMDNQILRDLFTACMEAYEALGEAASECRIEAAEDVGALIRDIGRMRSRLVPNRIASNGTVMEWMEEYQEVEPGHRHISHLYGLYPSDQITVDGTPELAAAARKTLEARLAHGGGHTGWSRAWIINHYAKLWDGDTALAHIHQLLGQSVYPNLFDKHPPFQIDGNFGVTAAIAQMLAQSSKARTVLLPALPKAWQGGAVTGLRLIGNGEVDIAWEDGELLSCTIYAHSDLEMVVKYREATLALKLAAGGQRGLTREDFS